MTRWESIVCVHQPVRVSVCAWLFFSFLSLSSRWRILRGGGRAGGTGGWVGRNMKRSLVHSLFSLSLSLSRVCVFCFLERALAPQGPSQVKLFSLSLHRGHSFLLQFFFWLVRYRTTGAKRVMTWKSDASERQIGPHEPQRLWEGL